MTADEAAQYLVHVADLDGHYGAVGRDDTP
jgi:hypothetical protein